ncbi:MAG TPA: DUF302 domain-containing protein [Actinomycetes bacterium]|nr:DUF302 domain-containing protein [Actinomycetes bacterium]
MDLSLKTHVSLPFDEAVSATRDALAEQGFGVLTEIDVKATMKAKLDKDVGSFLILGACNPPLAYQAISAQASIGVLLPCNVVVRQDGDDVLVEAVDPAGMMSIAGDASLDAVASEATDRLRAALGSLAAA